VLNAKSIVCPICRAEHPTLTQLDQVPKNYGLIPSDLPKVAKRSLNDFLSPLQTPAPTVVPHMLDLLQGEQAGASTSFLLLIAMLSHLTQLPEVRLCNIVKSVIMMMMMTMKNEEKDDQLHPATYTCLECNENMCDLAAKFHKKQKFAKQHHLIPLLVEGEIDIPTFTTKQGNGIVGDKPFVKRRKTGTKITKIRRALCKEHGKALEYFDEHCQRLNCMDCCMQEHQGNQQLSTFHLSY
jgi:hypothetical protein